MASNRGRVLSSSSSSSLEESEQPSNGLTTPSSGKNIPRVRSVPENEAPEMKKHGANPFSFKHFLRKDPSQQTSYQNSGARPKVYSPVRMNSNPDLETLALETDEIYPRNKLTELPDFVQDHLVIEQCYLNPDADVPPIIPDVDNLPDFAINSMETRTRHRADGMVLDNSGVVGDLLFDLTGSLERRCRDNSVPNSHLERRHNGTPELREPMGFPLDLPISTGEGSSGNANSMDRSPAVDHDANVPKSLPDFLSDGPIRTRVAPQPESPAVQNSNEPLDRRLLYEIDQLRHDLGIARRQNSEKNRRIQLLEAELVSRRVVDHEETAHLEKAMEQVEDNLKRSTRRAVNAESTVTALKHEVKALKLDVSVLQAENQELRASLGVEYNDSKPASNEKKIRRLAGDLRDAASSANSLLRQLMSGVDNLKVIASAMENVDRIEDRTKDFLLDFDEDNAAGPAL